MARLSTADFRSPLLWLKRRFSPQGLILMYHRVAEVNSDPWGICVSPSHFAEHLEVLLNHGWVVPLTQLVQALQSKTLRNKTLAVTFDDGYADNVRNAKPLLKQFTIPVTLFVATGGLDQREFWWDDLARFLLEAETLPEHLRLTIDRRVYSWSLGKATYLDKSDHQRYDSWKAWQKPPTERHALYLTLYHLLFRSSAAVRSRILDEMASWAIGDSSAAPARLSIEHLTALAKEGLFEIGAHTVTHSPLALLSPGSQQQEIRNSKTWLERKLSRPVISFAFPHGNFSDETISIVRDEGFQCACTTAGKVITQSSDPFKLPRFQVLDWDGKAFAKQVSNWLTLNSQCPS